MTTDDRQPSTSDDAAGPAEDTGVPTEDADVPVVDLDAEVYEDRDAPEYDVSTSEDRERLLAAAMVHAESQDAQYKLTMEDEQKAGQWKSPLALVVLALAGYIALSPPVWLAGPAPPLPTTQELESGVVAALTIQAEQIRAFQVRNGRLPTTLDEVPTRVRGIRYVRSNNRVFQLVAAMPDGGALVYDAARPDPRFETARAFIEGPGS